MKMAMVGLWAAMELGGCAPAVQSHVPECDLTAVTHGMCRASAPRGEAPRAFETTMQVRLITHKDEVRRH